MKSLAYYSPEINTRQGQKLSCDLCIYGGTSAGVIAAIEASRRGRSVVLLVNTDHIGGLASGGLGYTDYGNFKVIGGMAREFYTRLSAHYNLELAWRIEPHIALKTFLDMLKEAKVEPILFQYLDRVSIIEGAITSIRLQSGLEVSAAAFMDATYEGDLMAKAGVPYTVGREDNSQYGEFYNGSQVHGSHQFEVPISPWKKEGDPSSGVLLGIDPEPLPAQGTGDKRVQAYNFRLCMSRGKNRIPFSKPADYNPEHYELLARYLKAGWREVFHKFDILMGDKTDTNNHGAVSTDFIGWNHDYPEASYEKREKIFQDHVHYQQGLFWFYCHDPRVPADVQKVMNGWGLAEDEFTNYENWSPQLYVRESRRMVSDYVITELDCRGYRSCDDPIAYGAYGMDSHNCRRAIVGNRVVNDGDVQCWGFPPYPISYRSVIPPKGGVKNLFVPVCASASHISYGSIRMEPVFMILAQSCAIAADLCIKHKCSAQDLSYAELKPELEKSKQVIQFEKRPMITARVD